MIAPVAAGIRILAVLAVMILRLVLAPLEAAIEIGSIVQSSWLSPLTEQIRALADHLGEPSS